MPVAGEARLIIAPAAIDRPKPAQAIPARERAAADMDAMLSD